MRFDASRLLARVLCGGAMSVALGGALLAQVPAGAAPAAPKADFVRATIVNNDGNPVPGVRVRVRDVDTGKVFIDQTDAMGVFRVVVGAKPEEFSIRVNGQVEGFETGFLACNHTVVPTRGEACSQGTGRIGKYRIDRLR